MLEDSRRRSEVPMARTSMDQPLVARCAALDLPGERACRTPQPRAHVAASA